MQHHYSGHWKGWALKIKTFLGPEVARARRVPFGPKKVEPTPSNAPRNDVAPLKIITYRAIKTTGTLIVIESGLHGERGTLLKLFFKLIFLQ
jgi:hypothetical protein